MQLPVVSTEVFFNGFKDIPALQKRLQGWKASMITEQIHGDGWGAQEGSGDKDGVSGLRYNGTLFTNADSVSTDGSQRLLASRRHSYLVEYA